MRAVLCAAMVGLAGCTQSIAALPTTALPQASWADEKVSTSNLLYIAVDLPSETAVYVMTYPQGKIVGTLTGFKAEPLYLCSGSSGNVFVTAQGGGSEMSYVYEFKPGHTRPIAILNDPGDSQGRSVHPTTGDLAVPNLHSRIFHDNYGNIAIYRKARGSPKIHRSAQIHEFQFCSYDSQGNLLADGGDRRFHFGLVMLPHDSQNFRKVTLDKPITTGGPVQWDGSHFAIGYVGLRDLYRVAVLGSTGHVVRTVHLSYKQDYRLYEQFWIQGDAVVAITGPQGGYSQSLGFWRYPAGGKDTKFFGQVGMAKWMSGVTMSVRP